MAIISAGNSQKIKNMSIVCAMLVVTIHVLWPTDKVCLTWFINELVAQGIARIAVPFFFIVSGFFLAAHFDDKEWWKKETAKRIHSLVIPYFVWCILCFLTFMPLNIVADMIAHRPFGTNLPISNGRWTNAMGLDIAHAPSCVPLWYVRCLFFFVLLSPIFKLCVDKFKTWWLIFAFVPTTIFSYSSVDTDHGPFWACFLYYGISLSGIFYFSAGIYLKRFHISFCSTPLAIASGIYGMGCLLANTYVHLHGKTLPIGVDCLSLPALMYAIWHLMPARKFPFWLTTCSFPIFLLHWFFLQYAELTLKHCPFDEQVSSFIACFVAIVAPLVLTNLLRKFSPKTANFLFAGRS